MSLKKDRRVGRHPTFYEKAALTDIILSRTVWLGAMAVDEWRWGSGGHGQGECEVWVRGLGLAGGRARNKLSRTRPVTGNHTHPKFLANRNVELDWYKPYTRLP